MATFFGHPLYYFTYNRQLKKQLRARLMYRKAQTLLVASQERRLSLN